MRGSIRRGGKGSWEIRIELEKVNGKRKSLSKHVTGSKQDAQKELTKLLAARDDGTLADPTRVKLEEYLRQWLAGATHLAPKTHERYSELCERQIYPTWEHQAQGTAGGTHRELARDAIVGGVERANDRSRSPCSFSRLEPCGEAQHACPQLCFLGEAAAG